MAYCISATDLAIAEAVEAGTLRKEYGFNQRIADLLGEDAGWYVAICDEHGVIEVAGDDAAADARIEAVRGRLEAARSRREVAR